MANSSLSRIGVVIADDQPDVRGVVRDLLIGEGVTQVFDAEDGVDCLQLMRQHGGSIKLLVLDLGMPRLSGLQVIESLMEVHRHEVAILVISNESNLAVLADRNLPPCRHLRIEQLQKPFPISAFVEHVRALVSKVDTPIRALRAETSSGEELHRLSKDVNLLCKRMREIARVLPSEDQLHSELLDLHSAAIRFGSTTAARFRVQSTQSENCSGPPVGRLRPRRRRSGDRVDTGERQAHRPKQEASEAMSQIELTGHNVLVMGGENDIGGLLVDELACLGASVALIKERRQALDERAVREAIAKHAADFVIVTNNILGADEAFGLVQRLAGAKTYDLILMSGIITDEMSDECDRIGVFSILMPFQRHHLSSLFGEILHLRSLKRNSDGDMA